MRTTKILTLVALAGLAGLACGVINTITGSETNLQTASELWSDVPRMDGLTPSDAQMPAAVQLLMRTVMSQVLAGGAGGGDWIVFNTQNSPEDVAAFYTNARMAENGWTASDNSTCLSGSDQGISQVGVFCVFVKEATDRQIGLMIIASPIADSQETSLVFIRIENQVTPAP